MPHPIARGDFRGVTKIAKRNRHSQVATLVAAGLAAFASAPPHFTDGKLLTPPNAPFSAVARFLLQN